MKQKHLIVLAALLAAFPMRVFARDSEPVDDMRDWRPKYYIDDICYRIINDEPREVMVVDPCKDSRPIIHTWYYSSPWFDVIDIPSSVIIEGEEYAVTTIASESLMMTDVEVRLPGSVRYMEHSNLWGCNGPLDIRNGVERMDDFCIHSCKSDHLRLPSTLRYLGNHCVCENSFSRIDVPRRLRTIGSESFCHNELLEEIELPATLEEIGHKSFCHNPSLRRVVMPVYLASMHGCFNNCPDIRVIEFQSKDLCYPIYESFDSIDPEKCVLIVPDGGRENFYSWLEARESPLRELRILEKSEESFVQEIAGESSVEPETYFTLSGLKADPGAGDRGILIRRTADRTEKVLITE